MYEALERLRFGAFLNTCGEECQQEIKSFISNLHDTFGCDDFGDHLNSSFFSEIIKDYAKFISERSEVNETFAFWSIYLKMAGKKQNVKNQYHYGYNNH